MAKTYAERYEAENISQRRTLMQELAILQVTDLIEEVMEKENITRAKLATMLGRTKGWVTQLLDGDSNKTIRTVADVLAVLGREFTAYAPPICISNETTYRAVLNDGFGWQDEPKYTLAEGFNAKDAG
jgi:transcriptional regulator with XRE-family HTH domain